MNGFRKQEVEEMDVDNIIKQQMVLQGFVFIERNGRKSLIMDGSVSMLRLLLIYTTSYQYQTHQTLPDSPHVTRLVHRSQQPLLLQVKELHRSVAVTPCPVG